MSAEHEKSLPVELRLPSIFLEADRQGPVFAAGLRSVLMISLLVFGD
jgi:hypothetical protein|tara:strand:+ start:14033 stop:14173 length:141 start_codon:yes stop_codon:yes gene_type:complete